MKYVVTVGDRTIDVEVDGGDVIVGGRRRRAQFAALPQTPLGQLVLDEQSRVVGVTPGGAGGAAGGVGGVWLVELAGERWNVLVEDERSHALRALTGRRGARAAGGVLRAPMAGLVLRVEVEEGQTVEAGQGVVVLEAMKMENEISAPGAGVVTKIHVRAGDAVEKGAVLAEVAAGG